MLHSLPLTRRRFLQMAAAGLAVAAGDALRPSWARVLAEGAEPQGVYAMEWPLRAADFAAAENGSLLSPVQRFSRSFNAVGIGWDGPADAAPQFFVRASDDGYTWSPWSVAPHAHPGLGPEEGIPATDLVFVSGRFLQIRYTGATLAGARVTVLDSSAGPASDALASVPLAGVPVPPGYSLQAFTPPSLTYRGGWGANESYRFKDGREIWPPRYAPAQKIIIHHTVTANNPADSAAAVRAIYFYHAVTLGWGDIGYNYVIDHNGRIFIGRYGFTNSQGWPVIGGHALQYNPGSIGIALLGTFTTADPPPQMVEALTALVSAQVVRYGIHPTSTSRFIDKVLPNIMGHRDCIATSCPGDKVYALLDSIREQALANVPPTGVAFIRNQIPLTLLPGQSLQASVTVKNSGSRTWVRTGATPDRLGVRWFRQDGSPYTTEMLERRIDLPRDVPPGQDVTIPLQLVAPGEPGTYQFRADMVQESVQWFSDVAGNLPLNLTITVATDLTYRVNFPFIGRQTTAPGGSPFMPQSGTGR